MDFLQITDTIFREHNPSYVYEKISTWVDDFFFSCLTLCVSADILRFSERNEGAR